MEPAEVRGLSGNLRAEPNPKDGLLLKSEITCGPKAGRGSGADAPDELVVGRRKRSEREKPYMGWLFRTELTCGPLADTARYAPGPGFRAFGLVAVLFVLKRGWWLKAYAATVRLREVGCGPTAPICS